MRSDSTRRGLGIGLLSAATLLAELILTRVLSAGLYHHIAFVVLSTALLGTGVAAVYVSIRSRGGAGLSPQTPSRAALAFAITLPLCFALSQWVAAEPLRIALEPTQLLRMGATYLLLAVPFFCAGVAIATLLSQFTKDVSQLYGADLLGAAMGSLAGLFAVRIADGQDALLLAAALAALAAWAWSPGKALPALVVSALLLLGSGLRIVTSSPPWLPLHISQSKTTPAGLPFAAILRDPKLTSATTWTVGARVDRVRFGPRSERLVLDAGTAAVRVPPADFQPAASDATLPYELRPGGRFLIIGSGAGWEVAEALAFGAASVDAVEINPAVAAAVPAHIANDERAHIYVDEGRSFTERATGPYDGVIMVHTISNSASASGAMYLAEDFLFTTEALGHIMKLLSPDGLLFITRPEVQLPRLLSTLRAASMPQGPLAARTLLWSERSARLSFYGALLVSPTPFAAHDLQAVHRRIQDRRRLKVLATPGSVPADPLYAALLARNFDLDTAQAQTEIVLSPPSDDRPFFHQRRSLFELSWRDVQAALSSDTKARMALEAQPLAELSSLAVLLETIFVAGLALLIPLFIGKSRDGTRSIHTPRIAIYFGSLGLGFMLLEVSMIQRLGLVLGQPQLAIGVVFTGLLVGAGVGSLLSPRWRTPRNAVLLTTAATLALAVILPVATQYALSWGTGARVGLALTLSSCAGLVLGAPFPLGLQRIPSASVPWAFAVNAFASVAATVIALLLAAELGFFAVTLLAAALYAVAALSFPKREALQD